MKNPFSNASVGNNTQQNGLMQFMQFMNQNKGNNSNDMLQQLVASGRFNQQQLSQAQQIAQQLEAPLAAVKSMFGF